MRTQKFYPGNWTTFQGNEVNAEEIDQQHLSNVYWYMLIFLGVKAEWVFPILARRFNGQLLEYRPHVDFTQEIDHLRSNGFLQIKSELVPLYKEEEIVYRGKVIGRVVGDWPSENKKHTT